jgi:adenine-specific DNA methylase
MIHPKRLIEISLPLAKISEQSAREKSIRHGHISTLHIWWSRRPIVTIDIEANLVDLSVKESVIQFSLQGKVETE